VLFTEPPLRFNRAITLGIISKITQIQTGMWTYLQIAIFIYLRIFVNIYLRCVLDSFVTLKVQAGLFRYCYNSNSHLEQND